MINHTSRIKEKKMLKDYIEDIRAQLKDRNLMEVSRNLGMSYFTLNRFAKSDKGMNTVNLIQLDEYLNKSKEL